MSSQSVTFPLGYADYTFTLVGANDCPCTNISVTEDDSAGPDWSFTTDVDQQPGTVTISYAGSSPYHEDKGFTITFLDAMGDPHITPMFGDKYDL